MNQNQVKIKIATLIEEALKSQFPEATARREDLVQPLSVPPI